MTATDATFTPDVRPAPLRAFLALLGFELRRFLRNPMGLFFTLGFPIIFFALFGLPNLNGQLAGTAAGPYLIVSYACYGLMLTALSNFGVNLAREREQGWNRLLRVTPVPVWPVLGAKVAQALLVGLGSLLLLLLFAGVAGHVWLPVGRVLTLTVTLLAAMLPFLLLGAAIAYRLNAAAAVPVIQIVVLILAFTSGLFIPLEGAPDFVRHLAPYLPSYHMAQLGWGVLGARGTGSAAAHWVWLAGYAALFGLLALSGYQREEQRDSA